MTIPKVQLVMLPLSNWKVARVIRFIIYVIVEEQ